MVEEAELQALEEAIAANPQESILGESEPEPQPEPQPEAQPQVEESKQEDGLDEVYNQSPAVEDIVAGEELPPPDVRSDDNALRDWLARRTTSALTKIRQKEKPKVTEYMESLKVEDVIPQQNVPQTAEERKSMDELLSKYPDEQKEDLKPAADFIQSVARNELSEMQQLKAELNAQNRRQREINDFNQFKQLYDGFPLTPDMVSRAKQIQQTNPAASNMTVAQVIEQTSSREIMDWKIDQKVAARLAAEKENAKPEYPGASTAKSDARTPQTLDINNMPFEDFEKLMMKNLGVAEQK